MAFGFSVLFAVGVTSIFRDGADSKGSPNGMSSEPPGGPPNANGNDAATRTSRVSVSVKWRCFEVRAANAVGARMGAYHLICSRAWRTGPEGLRLVM